MLNRRLLLYRIADQGPQEITITLNPASFIAGSNFTNSNTANPIGKSETNTTYSTHASVSTTGVTCIAYFKFDTSSIPANATIISVECKAKSYINTTTTGRASKRQIQMCSGTTVKGSATTITTAASAATLTCGTWTRTELNDCRIRLYGVRGTNKTGFQMRFYGATLTIKYSA